MQILSNSRFWQPVVALLPGSSHELCICESSYISLHRREQWHRESDKVRAMQAFIGMGLAIGKTAERGHSDYGTPLGNAHKLDTSQAVWNIFTAFGSMAFAYSYVNAYPITCLVCISLMTHSGVTTEEATPSGSMSLSVRACSVQVIHESKRCSAASAFSLR